MTRFSYVEYDMLGRKLAHELASGRKPEELRALAEAMLLTENDATILRRKMELALHSLQSVDHLPDLQPHKKAIKNAEKAIEQLIKQLETTPGQTLAKSYIDLMTL